MAYKVRDNIFLVVDNRGIAYWSDIPSRASYKCSITEHMLIELVEYLIDNIYISVENRVYRQCVGIPILCAFAGKSFLFYDEYRTSSETTYIMLAKKFNHTMRYIDDLLTLNNGGLCVNR